MNKMPIKKDLSESLGFTDGTDDVYDPHSPYRHLLMTQYNYNLTQRGSARSTNTRIDNTPTINTFYHTGDSDPTEE